MDANKNRTPVVQGGNTSDGQYTRLARYSTRSASRQSNNRLHQQLTCGEGVGFASACVIRISIKAANMTLNEMKRGIFAWVIPK
jgi:hypothetical protein